MCEDDLIQHCSPTLAGIKTGNLFLCPIESEQKMERELRSMNIRLKAKGLRLLQLRKREGKALLYLYRPVRLKEDLNTQGAKELLRQAGYSDLRENRCIGTLISRLKRNEDFPHEIGLFLSYPPEDVRGFLEHKGKDFKCSGIWKVYGDPESAQKTFEQYRKCTRCYMRQRLKGIPLERLAVRDNHKEKGA